MQDPARVPSRSDRVISHFEELAALVWPPAEIRSLDGWRLCFAGGCTKRANSVHCVSGGSGGAQQRVERCEAIYRDYGQRVVFKLTDASFPQGIACGMNSFRSIAAIRSMRYSVYFVTWTMSHRGVPSFSSTS